MVPTVELVDSTRVAQDEEWGSLVSLAELCIICWHPVWRVVDPAIHLRGQGLLRLLGHIELPSRRARKSLTHLVDDHSPCRCFLSL